MPEPKSSRSLPPTAAAVDAPFESIPYPFGSGGLNLAQAVDRVPVGQFTRLTNVVYSPGESQQLSARAGQRSIIAGGNPTSNVHSIARLTEPNAAATRVWGVDTSVALGLVGTFVVVDTGYSDDPLTLVPYHTAINGDAWMFIGDRAQMRKVRADGLAVPIGLPAPTAVATFALDTLRTTGIANFNDDGTAAANWVATGQSTVPDAAILVAATDLGAASPSGTYATNFSVSASNGVKSEYVATGIFGCAKVINLSAVGDRPALDDDYLHTWLRMATLFPPGAGPGPVEARVYFVCSPTFDPTVIPGATPTGLAPGDPVPNTDAYLKVFTPNPLQQTVQAPQVQPPGLADAVTQSNQATVLTQQQDAIATARANQTSPTVRATIAGTQLSTALPINTGPGAGMWQEYAVPGVPLQRGDWFRIGNTAGADWSTVTGIIVVLILTVEPSALLAELSLEVALSDMYLFGGSGPDSGDPTASPYDYRATHYDPRTGAEGNPSPLVTTNLVLDSLRTGIVVTPPAAGDEALRQRLYRRGGLLQDNWYFVGMNSGDGAAFTDEVSDAAAALAGTVPTDHYQPVPTQDVDGNTVLAQPVPVILGPVNGQLLALGDPYRPGFVYASLVDEPDHWPPDLATEVCPPSEELMNGALIGGQVILFSRARAFNLYLNVAGQSGVTALPSGCQRGLAGRWALTVGYGSVWFVASDGVYRTSGAGPEVPIANDILPLFQGQSVNGYAPINLAAESSLRMACYQQEVWFGYEDVNGAAQILIYQVLTGQWRHYHFAADVSALYAEEDASGEMGLLLLGGKASGQGYTHTGTSDAGEPIAVTIRTAAAPYGQLRAEKVFGDQMLSVDRDGATINLQNFFDEETVANPVESLSEGVGRTRAIFDGFGHAPQRARNLATEISWATADGTPTVYYLATAVSAAPELTINRVTTWDDLGSGDDKYVVGCTLDCDTGGVTRTIVVEGDNFGTINEIATLSVNTNGRHKVQFSWPAQTAAQIRLRPDDDCKAWILYRLDWIVFPEPPAIPGWDIHFENAWDQYYTGLDLYVDTFGGDKQVQVTVDGVALIDPQTAQPYFTVNTNGRQVVHLTFTPGRGHVFHLVALDTAPGRLYDHRWHTEAEPSEQANWNQNFSPWGITADKYLKAVIFECDTFGQDKTVAVEADGVQVDTLTVNASGRKVVQVSLTQQQLGRIWRLYPTDANPGRLYSAVPVFDVEPYQLGRWETQQIDHDEDGFYSVLDAMVTIKSTADVILTVETTVNQTGTVVSDTYRIPTTAGVKVKTYVPFNARKGVLTKYAFTSGSPFWLYREESSVRVQPWSSPTPVVKTPFGNDDLDVTRAMTSAPIAAARAGGGSA